MLYPLRAIMIIHQAESINSFFSEKTPEHTTITQANFLQLMFGSFFSAKLKRVIMWVSRKLRGYCACLAIGSHG